MARPCVSCQNFLLANKNKFAKTIPRPTPTNDYKTLTLTFVMSYILIFI